ncbi:MAG: DUF748 domain-containing protein [Candidatus Omnitrophica bacterium]|nr:DUF748 domain-containing protein [Candidatus Omnitrophota bacterium]
MNKRILKKRIFISIFVLILIVCLSIFYLNTFYLPTKIKFLIVRALKEQTHKEVTLESLQFNIFKGLVLEKLSIYDSKKNFLSLEEASCNFFLPPIFKKTIIIPSLRVKSPVLLIERRNDKTFNIQDLFSGLDKPSKESKFNFSVYKVSVIDGTIHFYDYSLSEPFSKDIEHINLNLYFSLPAAVKFNLKTQISANPEIKIISSGEYNIPKNEFIGKASFQNVSVKDFIPYYSNSGFDVTGGLVDAMVNLKFKDNLITASLGVDNKNLEFSKNGILAKLNSKIDAQAQYNINDKLFGYSGKASIMDAEVSGVEQIGTISLIKAEEVIFSDKGIKSDNLSATILGFPVKAKGFLNNYDNPEFGIDLQSSLSLAAIKQILAEEFKFKLPGELTGAGNLTVHLESSQKQPKNLQLSGNLILQNGVLKLDNVKSPFEQISGRLDFSQNQLKWTDIRLNYLGSMYKLNGALTNFASPGIQLKLASDSLNFDSSIAVNNKLITITDLTGRYFNSEFRVSGELDTKEKGKINAALSGDLEVNLQDLKEPLKQFKSTLDILKPSGMAQAQFDLKGDLNDFKNCNLRGRISSKTLSLYDLKPNSLTLNYSQSDGTIDIHSIEILLYGGIISANAKLDLTSEGMPYSVTFDAQKIKLEELRKDIAATKNQDIAGLLKVQCKLNGLSGDFSKLEGLGQILVSEGRLWQLDLFKGLGAMLFSKDFSKIIFSEGSCTFTIKDKYISTEDLKLKSSIANLTGNVKIGFDSSIDSSLDVEVFSDMVPLTGTFKDVTTAIVGEAGRFGVIKITGTLKEPKYKFKAAVADIIKGIKNVFFGK